MHSYSSVGLMIPRGTPCIRMLIIINVVCWFFLVLILQKYILNTPLVYHVLGFVPDLVNKKFFIHQFFTYMFIHSDGVFHILFNMLVLWMFGSELEQLWGRKFFLTYYLVCGVGSAGVYWICMNVYLLLGGQVSFSQVPVVGASGAIFGLLLAYGWIFGERLVLFMLFVPMKARTFTILIAAVELLTVLSSGFGSPMANLSHLGGLISGFLFLYLRRMYAESQTQNPYWKVFKMVRNKFKKNKLTVIGN